MRVLSLLCASIFVFSCNQKPTISNGPDTSEPASIEYLSWEGLENMPHVVLIAGDEEYRSEEALPQLAKILSLRHGFRCTVLFSQNPDFPGIVDPNYSSNIPGLESLDSADLMILFTRFRALPNNQMKHIDDFLMSGKPVLGIRTSTHAFAFKEDDLESSYTQYGNYYDREDDWKGGFGKLVMGEQWVAHHGKHGDQSTKGIISPGAETHPILNGIANGDIWGPSDVYRVRLPLPGDAQPLVLGQVLDREGAYDENDPLLGMRSTDHTLPELISEGNGAPHDQNNPMMPIAWTKSYQLPNGRVGKCFSTTIGAAPDLLQEGTRRMIVNSVFWLLDLPVPEKSNVDLVGEYTPSRFAFHNDAHWKEKNLIISQLK